MDKQKYIIIGFSGAGKTHLLEMLQDIGKSGDDLDQLVIKGQYSSSRQMIIETGLANFRRLEFSLLKDWLTNSRNQFLALGGGSIHKDSLELINNSNIKAIYLDKPFEECWSGLNHRQDSFLIELGREKALELYNQRKTLFNSVQNSLRFNSCEKAFQYLLN